MDTLTEESGKILCGVTAPSWFNRRYYGVSLQRACLQAVGSITDYRRQVKFYGEKFVAKDEELDALRAEKKGLEEKLALATQELAKARRDLTDTKAAFDGLTVNFNQVWDEKRTLEAKVESALTVLSSEG